VEVRRIRWLGIPTDQYGAMRALFEDVMGLGVNFDEPATVELETMEGDRIQLLAPGHPYFDFFREHARGPVALFEVDDVQAARTELEAAGIKTVGEIDRDSEWEWIHVRAPDGTLFDLASRRRERVG
jgi:hypothetical protein